MAIYTICHADTLRGEAEVNTSKNAVLPILAASLLTKDEMVIHAVPALTDVETMLELLALCGVKWKREGRTVVLKAEAPVLPPDTPAMQKMRASVLLAGPLLSRTGQASMLLPGGCAIGQRPVDIHLKGFQALGAQTQVEGGSMRLSGMLHGNSIYLDFPSVGATENLIMAACLCAGETRIENAAKEPEIQDLADCLTKMGAKIQGAGTGTIVISGVKALHGTEFTPIPDRIEAGTLACAAALTEGGVLLKNARMEHLRAPLFKLQETGMVVREDTQGLYLAGSAKNPVEVRTLSYPGFPTDMQAPMMVVACKTSGYSVFLETIFENRYMHVSELARMGARIRVEGQLALVEGGYALSGAGVTASDLRAAAALVLAGLYADGHTVMADPRGHLERGYEHLEQKLCALGAQITRRDDHEAS